MGNEKDNNTDKNVQAPNVCTFSLPMMMSALHVKAAEITEKLKDNPKIANSAIEGEGKDAKLTSAGEHVICVTSSKQDTDIYKSDAILALQTYVTWFAGPDLSKKVNEKTVMNLVNQTDDMSDDNEKNEDGEDLIDNSTDVEEDFDDSKKENADESIQNKIAFQLISDGTVMPFSKFLNEHMLNEENKNTNDDGEPEEGKSGESSKGYYIVYSLKVNGFKESTLKDSIKSMTAKLFDVLSSFTITASGIFGGGASVDVSGKNIRKKLNRMMNIDTKKLAEDVQKMINAKFVSNITEARAFERDGKTLYNEIKEYSSQLSKEQMNAIKKAQYSLCVKIKEKDPAKPFINASKLAQIIRKCMSFIKFFSKHKVKEKTIIVIHDYVDKRESERSLAEKRPSYEWLKNTLLKMFIDRDGKKIEHPIYSNGYKIYTDVVDRFKSLKQSPSAMKQDENQKAVKLFDQFKSKKGKEFEDENHKFDFKKDFKEFLDEYKKFDDQLNNESISVKPIGIAKLLFEELFQHDDIRKYMSEDDNDVQNDTNQSKPDDDLENADGDAKTDKDLHTNKDEQDKKTDHSQESSSGESDDNETSSSYYASGNDSNKDGTTLYIYPIKNSKKFEDGIDEN